MKREELIAYDKWLTRRKRGTGEIISPEKAADLYLAAQPQPTAEGAEEILNKYPHSIEYPMFIHENNALAAMQEFATLHAQRLAEKMVEERLREELMKFDAWLTGHGVNEKNVLVIREVDEYLKSRLSHD